MGVKYRSTPWFVPAISAVLVLTILLYYSMLEQSKLIDKELYEIKEQRAWQAAFIAEQIEQRLQYAADSSTRLASALQSNFESADANPTQKFTDLIQPYPDGSIRSRKEGFNGQEQAGVYLPVGTDLSALQTRRLLIAKQTVETFGQGALSNQFSDTWFMNEAGGIVIFWPDEPDFVFKAKAGFSYKGTPWLTSDAPPGTYWTPLIEDPIPELLMLSAVTPVYVDGIWYGNVGHDITLQSLLDNAKLLKGAQQSSFILLNEKSDIVASDITHLVQTEQRAGFEAVEQGIWYEAYQKLWSHETAYLAHKSRLFTMSIIESKGWVLLTSMPLQPAIDKIDQAFIAVQTMAFISIAAEVIILTLLFAFFHRRNKAYVKHLQDMSQILSDEKLRYETLVDKIPSIVYRCKNDKYWTMMYLNGAIESATGYLAEDFIQNKALAFADIIYPDDQGMVWQVIQDELANSGRFKVIYRVIHRDGGIRWMIERGGYSDNQQSIEGVITDITELKEAEQKLKVVNLTLDEKVALKTSELQATNQDLTDKTVALEASLQALQQTQQELVEAEKMASMTSMVVGMAHEINTPLGNIATAESVMQSQLAGLLKTIDNEQLKKSELLRVLDVIEQSLQSNHASLVHLLKLSDKFQGLGYRHETDPATSRIFTLSELVTSIIEKYAAKFADRQVTCSLELEPDIMLSGPAEAMDEVLSKLIENSLKHGFVDMPSGNIWLNAQFSQNKRMIMLTYGDDGCGIEQAMASNIFVPFAGQALGKGSSGLGLSRVYNIIHQEFGGKIELQTKAQSGTHFVIHCPVK
ncbi:PAS domain-containing protein [Pseudoalteromonas luteoviolacea]|uniref:ATP-binding protein n=1 Tax=Pseudoalteromonas luteoviolacea TaxID=43657 RepID=UPI001EEE7FA6|nr:ATP-binding protein [Pseudoalteromonas luteoviolacea]MCF6441495.1 PAS domain-containing protein [Pseudoalteromonas luteoviolacea]